MFIQKICVKCKFTFIMYFILLVWNLLIIFPYWGIAWPTWIYVFLIFNFRLHDFSIEKSTREICRTGKILWQTTDGTSDSPFGPIKSADHTCASPGKPTRLALRQEKLTNFDGRVWQLMQSYAPCRYGQNRVATPLHNFTFNSNVVWSHKLRKQFQNARCSSLKPNRN